MSTDKKTLDWYSLNAAEYTDHVRNQKDSIYHAFYEKPAMYQLIPDIQNKVVLSLGCGSGEDSKHLKKLGAAKSVGIDITPELIAIAQSSYPECEFHIMDMEALNFAPETFDFVYSSLAIHYTEDWTKVFQEVFKVLKPNAYFQFSCAHPIRTAMSITEETKEKQIRQLAIVKRKEPKSVEIIGNYLDRRKVTDGLGITANVTTWHKSISEIIKEAVSAGFLIKDFVEPKPLEEMKKISERDYIRLNKIPEFMIFKLLKPKL